MSGNAQSHTENAVGKRAAQQPDQPYPAEKARGAEIILDTALKRWVFIAGLAGAVALALALSVLS
jgi:hypothetical protein